MRTRYDDVFAIGDVAAIKLPSGMTLPKAGVFAHYQAEVVTHNIVADIQGGSKTEFDGRGYCFLETGYGKAGFASGNFYTAPTTTVKLRSPSRIWHLGKILFEKYWMWRWF
jgi:sulfide:quinone oxidoreductase